MIFKARIYFNDFIRVITLNFKMSFITMNSSCLGISWEIKTKLIMHFGYSHFFWLKFTAQFNLNESQYKQRVATPHFSTWQNLSKKKLRKDKYWQKLLKNIDKR